MITSMSLSMFKIRARKLMRRVKKNKRPIIMRRTESKSHMIKMKMGSKNQLLKK